MTSTTVRPAVPLAGLRPVSWHRPLLALAVAMGALAVWAAVGMLVDPRQVTGLNAWAKPFKFAVSTAIYSLTLAWLIGLLPRARRVAWWAGTVAAVALTVEMVVITGVAASADTSHFNVSTPFHAVLWYSMAGFISLVWVANLVVAVLLLRAPLGDPARAVAVRAGVVLASVGMILALLMTLPPQSSVSGRASAGAIAGAHTVGLPDGGPGLPVLGWSTAGGDLRIPHFIGMHALQVLPIAVLLLELLGRRVPVLGDPRVRLRLVALATAAYAAVLAVLTWQALIGQSVVRPAGGPLVAGAVVAAATATAALLVIARGRRPV